MSKLKVLFIFFALGISGLLFVLLRQPAQAPIQWKEAQVGNLKPEANGPEVVIEKKTSPAGKPISAPGAVLPEKILVSMPFTTQAPFGNWDQRHEEACEEASLLMVDYYLEHKNLNQDIAEAQLQKIIDFEIANYGFYEDSTAAQIVQLGKDYFGLTNLKVIYDFPKEELKKELAKGNPVILVAAGQYLGNPNFSGAGPPYHVLVAKGYEGNEIITNDPGTRKGEGYRYNIDTLYWAIHDFPGDKDRILEGRKAMIVIE